MNIVEYADQEMLAIDVANQIAGDLENVLLGGKEASLAVPGGSTPGPIFDALCAAQLDWDRVTVLLTDERWVDEDHAQSNAAMLRKRLLTSRAAKAKFLPYYQSGTSVEDASKSLSDKVDALLPLSVVVLGMGADMHTASLFPGAGGLDAALGTDANHICPISVPGHDISRITLSANALNTSMSKNLVIFGTEKREALTRAMTLPHDQAPVAAILNETTIHWAP